MGGRVRAGELAIGGSAAVAQFQSLWFDIAFIGVNHPEHGPGFDLWVGGGLSTNPHLAVRLGAERVLGILLESLPASEAAKLPAVIRVKLVRPDACGT